jgi:hypothetical protein
MSFTTNGCTHPSKHAQKRFQLSQHTRPDDTTKIYSTEHNIRKPASPTPHTCPKKSPTQTHSLPDGQDTRALYFCLALGNHLNSGIGVSNTTYTLSPRPPCDAYPLSSLEQDTTHDTPNNPSHRTHPYPPSAVQDTLNMYCAQDPRSHLVPPPMTTTHAPVHPESEVYP